MWNFRHSCTYKNLRSQIQNNYYSVLKDPHFGTLIIELYLLGQEYVIMQVIRIFLLEWWDKLWKFSSLVLTFVCLNKCVELLGFVINMARGNPLAFSKFRGKFQSKNFSVNNQIAIHQAHPTPESLVTVMRAYIWTSFSRYSWNISEIWKKWRKLLREGPSVKEKIPQRLFFVC